MFTNTCMEAGQRVMKHSCGQTIFIIKCFIQCSIRSCGQYPYICAHNVPVYMCTQ